MPSALKKPRRLGALTFRPRVVDEEHDPDEFLEAAAASVKLLQLAEQLVDTRDAPAILELLEAAAGVGAHGAYWDPEKHPRWPAGTPKAGQFMKVGQRFELNGVEYDVEAVLPGKIHARVATKGSAEGAKTVDFDAKTLEKVTRPAAEPISAATKSSGAKTKAGTATVIDPYVKPESHDASIPIPKAAEGHMTPDRWKRFGKLDQERYSQLMERFGTWSPGKSQSLINHALAAAQDKKIKDIVVGGYASQKGSSTGLTLSMHQVFGNVINAIKGKGHAGADVEKAREDFEAARALQHELASAMQWDLYNRARAPDVSLFHKDDNHNDGGAWFQKNIIEGGSPVFSGLSLSQHWRQNWWSSACFSTPMAIRHIVMSTVSGDVTSGYKNEQEIAVADPFQAVKGRSFAWHDSHLSSGQAKWLEAQTKSAASGEVLEMLHQARTDPNYHLPIPPSPPEIVMDATGGKSYKEPPAPAKAIPKVEFEHVGADGKPEPKLANTLKLKPGDYIQGNPKSPDTGTIYVIVEDPSDSFMGVAYYKLTEGDGKTPADGPAYHFEGGGTTKFKKLTAHFDIPGWEAQQKADKGEKPPFNPQAWSETADQKFVQQLPAGTKFFVHGNAYEVINPGVNTTILSLTDNKTGKINGDYKTAWLQLKPGYTETGEPEFDPSGFFETESAKLSELGLEKGDHVAIGGTVYRLDEDPKDGSAHATQVSGASPGQGLSLALGSTDGSKYVPKPLGWTSPQPGDTLAVDGKKAKVTKILKDGTVQLNLQPGVMKVKPDDPILAGLFSPEKHELGAKTKLSSLSPGQKFHGGTGSALRPYVVLEQKGKTTVVRNLDTGETSEVGSGKSFAPLLPKAAPGFQAPEFDHVAPAAADLHDPQLHENGPDKTLGEMQVGDKFTKGGVQYELTSIDGEGQAKNLETGDTLTLGKHGTWQTAKVTTLVPKGGAAQQEVALKDLHPGDHFLHKGVLYVSQGASDDFKTISAKSFYSGVETKLPSLSPVVQVPPPASVPASLAGLQSAPSVHVGEVNGYAAKEHLTPYHDIPVGSYFQTTNGTAGLASGPVFHKIADDKIVNTATGGEQSMANTAYPYLVVDVPDAAAAPSAPAAGPGLEKGDVWKSPSGVKYLITSTKEFGDAAGGKAHWGKQIKANGKYGSVTPLNIEPHQAIPHVEDAGSAIEHGKVVTWTSTATGETRKGVVIGFEDGNPDNVKVSNFDSGSGFYVVGKDKLTVEPSPQSMLVNGDGKSFEELGLRAGDLVWMGGEDAPPLTVTKVYGDPGTSGHVYDTVSPTGQTATYGTQGKPTGYAHHGAAPAQPTPEPGAPESVQAPDAPAEMPATAYDPSAYVHAGTKTLGEMKVGDIFVGAKNGKHYLITKHGAKSGLTAKDLMTGKVSAPWKYEKVAEVLEPKTADNVEHGDLVPGDPTTIGKLEVGDQFALSQGEGAQVYQLVAPAGGGEAPEATIAPVNPDFSLGTPGTAGTHELLSVTFHAHAKDVEAKKAQLAAAVSSGAMDAPTDTVDVASLDDAIDHGLSPFSPKSKTGGGYVFSKVGNAAPGTILQDKSGNLWKVKQAGASPVLTNGADHFQASPDHNLKVVDLPFDDTSPDLGSSVGEVEQQLAAAEIEPAPGGASTLAALGIAKGDTFTSAVKVGKFKGTWQVGQVDGGYVTAVNVGTGKWQTFGPDHKIDGFDKAGVDALQDGQKVLPSQLKSGDSVKAKSGLVYEVSVESSQPGKGAMIQLIGEDGTVYPHAWFDDEQHKANVSGGWKFHVPDGEGSSPAGKALDAPAPAQEDVPHHSAFAENTFPQTTAEHMPVGTLLQDDADGAVWKVLGPGHLEIVKQSDSPDGLPLGHSVTDAHAWAFNRYLLPPGAQPIEKPTPLGSFQDGDTVDAGGLVGKISFEDSGLGKIAVIDSKTGGAHMLDPATPVKKVDAADAAHTAGDGEFHSTDDLPVGSVFASDGKTWEVVATSEFDTLAVEKGSLRKTPASELEVSQEFQDGEGTLWTAMEVTPDGVVAAIDPEYPDDESATFGPNDLVTVGHWQTFENDPVQSVISWGPHADAPAAPADAPAAPAAKPEDMVEVGKAQVGDLEVGEHFKSVAGKVFTVAEKPNPSKVVVKDEHGATVEAPSFMPVTKLAVAPSADPADAPTPIPPGFSENDARDTLLVLPEGALFQHGGWTYELGAAHDGGFNATVVSSGIPSVDGTTTWFTAGAIPAATKLPAAPEQQIGVTQWLPQNDGKLLGSLSAGDHFQTEGGSVYKVTKKMPSGVIQVEPVSSAAGDPVGSSSTFGATYVPHGVQHGDLAAPAGPKPFGSTVLPGEVWEGATYKSGVGNVFTVLEAKPDPDNPKNVLLSQKLLAKGDKDGSGVVGQVYTQSYPKDPGAAWWSIVDPADYATGAPDGQGGPKTQPKPAAVSGAKLEVGKWYQDADGQDPPFKVESDGGDHWWISDSEAEGTIGKHDDDWFVPAQGDDEMDAGGGAAAGTESNPTTGALVPFSPKSQTGGGYFFGKLGQIPSGTTFTDKTGVEFEKVGQFGDFASYVNKATGEHFAGDPAAKVKLTGKLPEKAPMKVAQLESALGGKQPEDLPMTGSSFWGSPHSADGTVVQKWVASVKPGQKFETMDGSVFEVVGHVAGRAVVKGDDGVFQVPHKLGTQRPYVRPVS